MNSLASPADVPLLITVPSPSKADAPPLLSAERRINPSWTVWQFKTKLESVTGIPPGSQDVRIRGIDGEWVKVPGGGDEDGRLMGEWGLRRGGEIEIHDLRPPTSNPLNPSTTAPIEKYTMPSTQYASLTSSVQHWKRTHQLGRFDPSAKTPLQLAHDRTAKDEAEINAKQIRIGRRCRVGGPEDGRRGEVAFVGEVEGLGGVAGRGARWVGVRLDEPVGRNDGSVVVKVPKGDEGEGEGEEEEGKGVEVEEKEEEKKVRLFECKPGFGVVVRPEKVEVGEEWMALDDLEVDGDMEEL